MTKILTFVRDIFFLHSLCSVLDCIYPSSLLRPGLYSSILPAPSLIVFIHPPCSVLDCIHPSSLLRPGLYSSILPAPSWIIFIHPPCSVLDCIYPSSLLRPWLYLSILPAPSWIVFIHPPCSVLDCVHLSFLFHSFCLVSGDHWEKAKFLGSFRPDVMGRFLRFSSPRRRDGRLDKVWYWIRNLSFSWRCWRIGVNKPRNNPSSCRGSRGMKTSYKNFSRVIEYRHCEFAPYNVQFSLVTLNLIFLSPWFKACSRGVNLIIWIGFIGYVGVDIKP